MASPTNPIYKLFKDSIRNEVCSVLKQIGDAEPYTVLSIPLDPDNTDYQEYLAWVAAGNTAEAAD